MSPAKWVEKCIEANGHEVCYRIILHTGRPQIGLDNTIRNPEFHWYNLAKNYFEKKYSDKVKKTKSWKEVEDVHRINAGPMGKDQEKPS